MGSGSWTSTGASSQIVPANVYREKLVIQCLTGTLIYLGFKDAAITGTGVYLAAAGSVIIVNGAMARVAVNAIGTGTGGYQEHLGVCD